MALWLGAAELERYSVADLLKPEPDSPPTFPLGQCDRAGAPVEAVEAVYLAAALPGVPIVNALACSPPTRAAPTPSCAGSSGAPSKAARRHGNSTMESARELPSAPRAALRTPPRVAPPPPSDGDAERPVEKAAPSSPGRAEISFLDSEDEMDAELSRELESERQLESEMERELERASSLSSSSLENASELGERNSMEGVDGCPAQGGGGGPEVNTPLEEYATGSLEAESDEEDQQHLTELASRGKPVVQLVGGAQLEPGPSPLPQSRFITLSPTEHEEWVTLRARVHGEGVGALNEEESRRWSELSVMQNDYRQRNLKTALNEKPSPYCHISEQTETHVDAVIQEKIRRAEQCYPASFTKHADITIASRGTERISLIRVEPAGRELTGLCSWDLEAVAVDVPMKLTLEATLPSSHPRPSPITQDKKAMEQARLTGADVVMSSSSFRSLVAMLLSKLESAELPFAVREHRRRTVFIDKPVPCSEYTARHKNMLYYRAAARQHLNAKASSQANLSRSEERAPGGAVYTYEQLWLGPLCLLVRCKHHAACSYRSERVTCSLKTRVEYLLKEGFYEEMSEVEYAQYWAHCNLRGEGSRLLLSHVAKHTSEWVSSSIYSTSTLPQAPEGFNMDNVLHQLHSLLTQLCQLPAGQQHLLRRPMCSPKFSVWKAGNFEETTFLAGVLLGRANEDAPTASKYDLKAMLRKSGKTNKRLITFQHPAMPNGLPQQPASCIASKPTPAPITLAVSAISKPRGGRSAWGRGLKRSRRGAR